MDRGRLRVGVLGVATLVAYALSLFGLDWFRASFASGAQSTIDLRVVRACVDGACSVAGVDGIHGLYATFAHLTFWVCVADGVLVATQIVMRVFGGAGNAWLGKVGVWLGMAVLFVVGATGFVFQPEAGAAGSELGFTVARGSGALAMLVGAACGVATMIYAVQHDLEGGRYTPVVVPGNPPRKFRDPVRTNADTKEITQEQVDEAKRAGVTTGATAPVPKPADTTATKP